MATGKPRSPYQPLPAPTSTARKRTAKKKNLSCRSERGLAEAARGEGEEIVEKLNSLKSMTNSILRSEPEEPEMPYYSKQRARIRIDTDHSIDLLDEIAFYEKKTRRQDHRREAVNRAAVEETAKLIDTYIQLMNEEESGQPAHTPTHH